MRMRQCLAPIALALLSSLMPLAGCGSGSNPPTTAEGTLVVQSTPPGAQIFIDGEDTGQRTPYDIIRQVQGGGTTFEVFVRLAGYEEARATVTVHPGQAVPVQFQLVQAIPPAIPPHTITGKVLLRTGLNTTTPATDAVVTAEGTGGEGTFEAILDAAAERAGTYYIFTPPGTYRVTATRQGYQPQNRDVTVISGEDRQTGVDITLNPE